MIKKILVMGFGIVVISCGSASCSQDQVTEAMDDYRNILRQYSSEDLKKSATWRRYVNQYWVPAAEGGDEALRGFKENMRRAGMPLQDVADFGFIAANYVIKQREDAAAEELRAQKEAEKAARETQQAMNDTVRTIMDAVNRIDVRQSKDRTVLDDLMQKIRSIQLQLSEPLQAARQGLVFLGKAEDWETYKNRLPTGTEVGAIDEERETFIELAAKWMFENESRNIERGVSLEAAMKAVGGAKYQVREGVIEVFGGGTTEEEDRPEFHSSMTRFADLLVKPKATIEDNRAVLTALTELMSRDGDSEDNENGDAMYSKVLRHASDEGLIEVTTKEVDNYVRPGLLRLVQKLTVEGEASEDATVSVEDRYRGMYLIKILVTLGESMVHKSWEKRDDNRSEDDENVNDDEEDDLETNSPGNEEEELVEEMGKVPGKDEANAELTDKLVDKTIPDV